MEESTQVRILAVDDDESALYLIRRMLEKIGHTVTPAQDAEEALQCLNHESQTIDLVITDIVMPDIDGWELARRIKELDPLMPIVAFTGLGPEDILPNLHVNGISHAIFKPVTVDQLKVAINDVLELKRRQMKS
ncbi:MAG: response regulator [Desulfobacterales bacterium]